ncbi:MAG: GNAT family N-acetyltransferase [Chloroflexi bacterium]|nr:GNAT family N-acetyltransferase [Chloroflexota bacterium]MCI0575974.1 GNAT family N-acetyltransferase [Chloroflexota bacterium]MCI0648244.1 GNAT family N-acetyltransferase [Chloroflexota bacterium]MCI0725936.1 GNAT family N-acetyltransferase [Chloroflexota bacterium]
MRIIDLHPDNQEIIGQTAALLVDAFQEHWPAAWPTLESALEDVRESLEPGRISRVAIGDDGTVLGWVAAIPEYDGNAWELHPMVVHPGYQGQGIGRALVADLEARVREQGGITLYLGTDDEDNMTSLSNTDLYPDVWRHLSNVKNLRGHPYEFYQKLGFAIVGVIPDANGPGKPDIIMAKRVGIVLHDTRPNNG